MRRSIALTLSTMLPLLVACSGGGTAASAGGAGSVSVKGLDTMKFEPANFTIKVNTPVNLTLDNGGQLPHDFVLTDGVSVPVKITADGGKKATGTFTATKAGTYTFVCSQPGHEAAGMKGTVTVQ